MVNYWYPLWSRYPMIASPLPVFVEAWFVSGEFFSPGARGVRSSNQVAPVVGPIGQSLLMISGPEPQPSLYLALFSFSRLFSFHSFLILFLFLISDERFSMSFSPSCTLAYLISASYLPYSTRCRILVLISTTRRKRERNSLPLLLSLYSPSLPSCESK